MTTSSRGSAPLDEAYLEELHEEFPGLRIVDKADDALSKLIDVALGIVTLGGQRSFLTRYVTTIGQTIYLPEGWRQRTPQSRYITLRHEAVHLRQFRRFGVIGTALIYLVPILPMGLAWGRARLEWEAYAETLRATGEVHGLDAMRGKPLQRRIREQFTGPAYGWMWPFDRTIQRWIDQTVSEFELETRRASN